MTDFTTTTNFALKKPTVGQAVDLWGTYVNSNFDEIDQQLQTLTVSIQTPDLEGLGNVTNTSPNQDDVLQFNGLNWGASALSIPSSINDLSDVDTSSTPSNGQVLTWSGSSWTAETASAASVPDGSVTAGKLDSGLQTQIGRILVTDDDDTPTNGQILQYSTADTEWKYADLPGSTVVTLSDVNSASLADNALLVYNSSAGEFQFESGATLRTTLGVDIAGTDNSTDISISSSTSYDYITLSAGQVLTINQVNLGTDVTGTLPVAQGGTGGTTASAARTNLGLGALATQDTITESQISDLGSYITASSTDTLTNKSGNISQWANDSGYLTAETNNLSTVSGTLGTANGGTGLTSIGTAGQVLTVNSGANALEYQTPLVALPITDSAGNNVLSESGGVVTLTADEANVGSNALLVDSSGYVGIGTSSPEVKLDVAGDILINNNSYLYGENSVGGNSKLIGRDSNDTLFIGDPAYANPTIIQSGNNYVGINTNGTERMRIDSSGNIGAPSGTNIYNASDQRLKQNITDLSGCLQKVLLMRGVSFNWIDKFCDSEADKTLYGLIAQELQIIDSNLVDSFSDNTITAGDVAVENPLRVNEKFIIPMLVESIKEQQTLIESQQSQIDALTARIEALENS